MEMYLKMSTNKKRTILILTNHILGLYNFRRELIQKLLENHEVIISTPYHDKIDYFKNLGCKIEVTEFDRDKITPIKDLKLIYKYIKLNIKYKPRVVLSYTIKPNIYGSIASRFTRTHNLVNITGLGNALYEESILSKFVVMLYRISLKKANRIFFQNSENQMFFEDQNLYKEKHCLLPGSGVNLEYFSQLPYPDSRMPIQFLFISRLIKEKGFDIYITAAQKIKRTYPEVVFHVLGTMTPEYESKVEEWQEDDFIVYHGRKDDIRPYLKNVHCVVHPSYYPEGMSNVLLESSASGRAVITTNKSGCKEVVDDGKNGFIVEPKNTEDLVFAIEKFIKLSYLSKEIMGQAGRKKVEEEFNRDIVTEAYIKEIDQIG